MVIQLAFVVCAYMSFPAELEIGAVARLSGVDPYMALAVQYVESRGNDKAVSRTNDWGRYQINCPTWRRYLYLSSCTQLLNRHVNIWSGIHVIKRYQDRYAPRKGYLCRVHGQHAWISHYNSGNSVTGRGVSYGNIVMAVRHRLMRADKKRAFNFGRS
jgi:hypothetical protein